MRRQGSLRGHAAGAPTLAAPVAVTLSWRLAGGVLAFSATTHRRGVSHHDCWSVSPSLAFTAETVVETCVLPRGCYVSRAAVAHASMADDTTYTFSYAILMRAGRSTWAGSASLMVTVGSDGSLTPPGGSGRTVS